MDNIQTRKILPGSPGSLDDAARSVRAVCCSETPCKVFTWDRGAVDEIILMSGVSWPNSGQVPLLDSHDRSTTQSVLGHARGFEIAGQECLCQVKFSATDEAKDAYQKIKEGHLTDFSIGYRVAEAVWIPQGKSKSINGRTFEGPVQVATRIEIKELSLVSIGADPSAKARESENLQIRSENMEHEETKSAVETERMRIREIQAMCKKFNLEDLGERMVADGTPIDQARALALDHIVRHYETPNTFFTPTDEYGRTPHGSIRVGREARDKRMDAVVDGLVLRSGVQLEKPAPGSNEYRGSSLVDVAKESLQLVGESTRGLSKHRVAELATRAHSTADFPSILENVANKTLLASYTESPRTYEPLVKIIDATDFREMSRTRLSEGPDLDEVPELGEVSHGTFSDGKESYSIKKYARLFAVSLEAVVNDDLAAFTRIPQSFGMAAQRRVADEVYSCLTANAAMGDGVALFHADHGNLIDPGTALSVDSLSTARLSMRVQRGLQGALLNLVPRYLLVPGALETAADQLIWSTGDASEVNAGIKNPFYGKLEVVTEPRLDDSSTTAWYLLASPTQCDTLELAFLDGRRVPVVESRQGWNVMGLEFRAVISFGVKAIDHRGLLKNLGA